MSEWNDDLVKMAGWKLPAVEPTARHDRRRLAAALRVLAERCVIAEASDEAWAAAADAAEKTVAALAPFPSRSLRDSVDAALVMNHAVFADCSALIGKSNPIAPPMELAGEGEVSIGYVTFGPVYEGAPGWVHGGFVAAAIDQVLGYAQLRRHQPSVTGSLTVRYLLPTPINRRLRIEARFESVSGRESILTARTLDGDRLLSEADSVFISIDPGTFAAKLLKKHGDTQ